jgi:hypothetical protein
MAQGIKLEDVSGDWVPVFMNYSTQFSRRANSARILRFFSEVRFLEKNR